MLPFRDNSGVFSAEDGAFKKTKQKNTAIYICLDAAVTIIAGLTFIFFF